MALNGTIPPEALPVLILAKVRIGATAMTAKLVDTEPARYEPEAACVAVTVTGPVAVLVAISVVPEIDTPDPPVTEKLVVEALTAKDEETVVRRSIDVPGAMELLDDLKASVLGSANVNKTRFCVAAYMLVAA